MNSSEPWGKPLSLPYLRGIWILFCLLLLPALFFAVGVKEIYLPFCSTSAALAACIASPDSLGLKPIKWADAAAAATGYFSVIFLSVMIVPVWEKLLKTFSINYAAKQEVFELLSQCNGMQLGILFISVCVQTPIVEEVLFRRIIYGELAKLNPVMAFICTSLIFSMMHFFILGIPGLFIMAIFFQFVFICRKNLAASILMHGTVNTIAFIVGILNG